MTDQPASPEDIAPFEALCLSLIAKIRPRAIEASRTGEHQTVGELVRPKVNTKAIDFALAHRPGYTPT